MASGPLVGGSNGGNNDGGSREKHRWHESKVYTRKSFNKRSKPTQNPSSNPNPPPPSNNQTLASSAVSANDAADPPVRPPPPPPPPPRPAPPLNPSAEAVASDDDSSSLNRRPPLIQIRTPSNGQRRVVNINLTSRSKHEVRHLRRKLVAELDQVRSLVQKLESKEHQVAAAAAAAAASIPTPTSDAAANYSLSQFSANDVSASTPVSLKRAPPMVNSGTASPLPLRRHLSVSVPEFSIEKEKRTPKANQYYRNSDFVLGKEKFPPVDSHKKSKSNGSKMVDHKLYNQAFKSCANLLQKLMKHKHGWVFNNPVDVKGLGLHDYYTIIRHPMDLGTVKSRLSKNWYKSPEEFAEDVRLTFRNAMTYNPKGQDVHIMAEQLSQIFEEQWPMIEAEYTYLSSPRPPVPAKRPPPPPAAVVDTRRFLERSDSTVHPVAVESRPKPVSYPQPHISRPPPLKKPKAKDLHKRDMTFDEKQKLSNNLQNLPPEKLDNIVQIIKKRNSALSQHDDEIEVDIDSVDAETLWELDRFVTNYKKSLSKNKRKAELARAQHHAGQERVQERVSDPVVHEVPKDIKTVANEKDVASSPPDREGKKGDNASGSSSSSSSSSGSGSSSSDSDSESSSACGSDAAQLPKT